MPPEIRKHIHAAGIAFNAQQYGDQPDALLLHGFGSDLSTWDSLCEILRSDRDRTMSYLRYDLRGFGCSDDSSTHPFSHSDDVFAIMDALGLEKCHLIGTSMGGAIALNCALNHPERISKLVLISPAVTAWEWSDGWRSLWRRITFEARNGNMDRARQLWWQHPLFATTRKSDAAQRFYDSVMHYSGSHWINDFQQPALNDVDRLHTLQIATLLLSGGQDLEDFRLISALIEAASDKVSRIDFPELGHLLYLEDPKVSANAILNFFH